MFSLLLLFFSCIFSSPWSKENEAQNVNFNPKLDPQSYYGQYDGHNYYPSPDDWRSETIYQFITDRFANGKPENDDGKYGGTDLYKVDMRHGGDFVGVMNKLDYIRSLGFTTIWISPVFQNLENSYHGYAQIDFTLLDDRFGTLNEFRDMVTAAHDHGIRVIVDIVVNHQANLLYSEGHESSSAPFHMHTDEYRLFYRDPSQTYVDFQVNNTYYPYGKYCDVYGQDGERHTDSSGGTGSYWYSDYHHNGDLNDYSDPYQNDLGKIYGIMDDLRTTHPRVTNKIIAMTKSLITSTDVDGIRMDTPMQVPLEFFKTWAPAVKDHALSLGKKNFLIFAEFYCSKNFAADMTGRGKTPDMYGKSDEFIDQRFAFDGGINYPFYFWFQNSIKNQQGGVDGMITNYWEDWNMFDWYNPYNKIESYTHAQFFNNHDQWRMASVGPDGFRKQDLSAFIILFTPGIPLFYYGDEQRLLTLGPALDGHSREDFMTSLAWDDLSTWGQPNKAIGDNYDMDADSFKLVRRYNAVREAYQTYACDFVLQRYVQPEDSSGLLLWSKACGTDDSKWMLFGFNSWKMGLSSVSGFQVFNTSGTIVNVFNPSETYVLDSKGYINSISFNGYEAKMFVKQENLKPLPPIITSFSPSHDSVFSTDDNGLYDSSSSSSILTFSFKFDQDVDVQTDKFETSNVFSIKESTCDTSNSCTVSVFIINDGIGTLIIPEDSITSKQSSNVHMKGNYRSRVRVGKKNNVLVNRFATKDDDLAKFQSPGKTNTVELSHKALGSEKYRVWFEESSSWTEWFKFEEKTTVEAPSIKSQSIKVQYFCDNSNAYFVESSI